jgi:ATP-binding cassette, subfamily B, multidrug efflux pump
MPGPRGGMRNARYAGKREKLEHPFKLLVRTLSLIVRENPVGLFIAGLFLLASAFASMYAYNYIGKLIDAAVALPKNSTDFSSVLYYIYIMAGFYTAVIVASTFNSILMAFVGQNALCKVRNDLFKKMEALPLSYFDQRTTGDVMSLYTNDVDTLRQLVTQSVPQLISSLVQVAVALVSMFTLSWMMTLISLGVLALIFIVVGVIGKLSGRYYAAQQKDLAKMNGFIEEYTKGQKVVKVFNHEQAAVSEFKDINGKLETSNFKANMYSAIMMPIVGNLNYLSYAITAMAGISYAIAAGSVTTGTIGAFLIINRKFGMPFTQISSQISFIFQGLAGAQRIFALLDEKPETDEGYVELVNVKEENGKLVETKEDTSLWAWKNPHHPEGENLTPLKGDIEFLDVDFAYVPDKLVLKDISLYAKPGQKIAFVGATGAGKTTITNLINRFYDLADGKIRYDNININKIKKKDLRKSLAIVLQDTHLFSGTIEDNIKYGKKSATHEEVVKAAELANADGFIERLPQGYKTYITGDGASLSQGQRQLIAIARAAITNPPVLILDEATSSIDTYTEHLIQQGMDQLMKGRTTFAIAHRLSTVENSDAIMVLDHGQIIERGSHKDLLALHGVYYQLYMGAFELE